MGAALPNVSNDVHNEISGSVSGSVVQAGHISVQFVLRLIDLAGGESYLADSGSNGDRGRSPEQREALADRLLRFVLDNPEQLSAAISAQTPARSGAPAERWVNDEIAQILGLLERGLAERRIADHAQAQLIGGIAVQLSQLHQSLPLGHEPQKPGPCPYPGLASFTSDQSELFVGREETVARLCHRLVEQHAQGAPLLVTGVSGAGKSSLLSAGLVPAFKRGLVPLDGCASWPVVRLRPGAQPLQSLIARVAGIAGEAAGLAVKEVRGEPAAFAALARRAARSAAKESPGEARLVLIVDQFEEIYLPSSDAAERAAFLAALLAAARTADGGPAPAIIVLGLRSDFLSRCAEDPLLSAVVENGQFLLGPMSPQDLRRAVAEPAARAGLALEDGLTSQVLADLDAYDSTAHRYQAGALPLLGYALEETWHRRRGRTLTLAGYVEAGRVGGAVSKAAEKLYLGLDDTDRRSLRLILLALVAVSEGVEDTRRRVRKDVILSLGTHTLLDRLLKARLVQVDQTDVEITHDALLKAWPRLTNWLTSDRDYLIVQRRVTDAARTWVALDRNTDVLFRGLQLDTAAAWVTTVEQRGETVVSDVAEFVQASLDAQDAAHRAEVTRGRHRKYLIRALAALSVVALGAAATAVVYGADADRQHDLALSRQLAAQSLSVKDTDPLLARRLALAAWHTEQTAEAREVVSALLTPQRGVLVGSTEVVDGASFSPDGKLLVTAGTTSGARLWDVVTGRGLGRLEPEGKPVVDVTFSPDGKVIAGTEDGSGTVGLWDSQTRQRIAQVRDSYTGGPVAALAFSADSSVVAVSDSNGAVQLADARTGTPTIRLTGHHGNVVALAFSPDGKVLVTASRDQTLRVWDAQTGNLRTNITDFRGWWTKVVFGRDGTTFLAAGPTGSASIWDVKTGARRGGLSFDPADTVSLSEGLIVTAGEDFTVRLWAVESGKLVRTIATGHTGKITDVAVGRDDSTIATTSVDGSVRLWNTSTGQLHTAELRENLEPGEYRHRLDSIAFSPDGKRLVSATTRREAGVSRGGTAVATLWEPSTGVRTEALSLNIDRIAAVGFRDDRTVAIVNSDTNDIQFWNLETGRHVENLKLVRSNKEGHPVIQEPMTFSQDGKSIFATDGGPPALYDSTTGALLGVAHSLESLEVRTATFNSAKSLLVNSPSKRSSGQMIELDFSAGDATLRSLSGVYERVAVAASRGDRKIVATANGKDIQLWDPATGARLGALLTGHTGDVSHLMFSPDGRILASASVDGSVRLWDPEGYTDPVKTLCAQAGAISRDEWVRFAPDEPIPRLCY
ncbi:AAA family ATPase [Lentzea sp. NPDC003310]|uniref:nSTAND1 domain-containing NTPase n=1 Tax=Lentzea sp. NPDC003310 TaxID=3154447 RepID=UPI0033AFC1D3